MTIKRRIQILEMAAKRVRRRKKSSEEEGAKRQLVRKWVVAAGLRPVDDLDKLTSDEYDLYCRFYDIDRERDEHEMPCNSWLIKDRHGEWGMSPVWYWYCEFKRGAMTREEYNRRVLEHAGLPATADVTSGSESSSGV